MHSIGVFSVTQHGTAAPKSPDQVESRKCAFFDVVRQERVAQCKGVFVS
jgi:hypothetical protein